MTHRRVPRVTVLINSYNYGCYVEEAIQSVLLQDYSQDDMEILLVDDGSSDDTSARVAKYAGRVTLIQKENGGQASALNAGFARARGEIIALLDADDVWLPQKIRRIVEAFDSEPEAGFVYHPSQLWDVKRNTIRNDRHDRVLSGCIPASRKSLLQFRGASTSGQAFRRRALQKLLPVPETLWLYADSYLMYLIIFVVPVLMVNEYLVRYRIHGQNSAHQVDGNEQQRRRRLTLVHQAVNEIRTWIEANVQEAASPDVRDYLRRFALWEEQLRLHDQGQTRFSLARHRQHELALYWPALTWPRRLSACMGVAAALLLGAEGHRAARKLLQSTQ